MSVRRRVFGIYVLLILTNLLAWACALIAFRNFPVLLGTSLLAYSFGLRHAVDADHIAAIDNVTRKLMQEGKRPVAVGFYFSLGHSTIVVLASVAIALTAAAFKDQFGALQRVGDVIGTLVSAAFLFAIAIANMIILVRVYRAFEHVKRGGRLVEDDLEILLSQRGLLGRLSPSIPTDFQRLAHVSAGLPLRARLRHRNGDRAPRHRGDRSLEGALALVHLGVPRVVPDAQELESRDLEAAIAAARAAGRSPTIAELCTWWEEALGYVPREAWAAAGGLTLFPSRHHIPIGGEGSDR